MILEYLMKSIDNRNPPKPCEVFDLIGGTSTGEYVNVAQCQQDDGLKLSCIGSLPSCLVDCE